MMNRVTYAMISTEMRRDLNDPINYFQTLHVKHLYNITPWNDMINADFSDRTIRYTSARELARRLDQINPDIVQGVEPFALKPLPRLHVINNYIARTQKPLVLVSLENIPFYTKYGPVAYAVAPAIRRAIQQAQLIIYINEGARRNFLHYGADPGRMVRLMYGCWGVDTDEYSPTGDIACLPVGDQRVILFVGRVHQIKGVFDLLNAFQQLAPTLPDTALVFIGAGPAEEKLRQLARERGLADRVHLLGTVKNRDLARYIRRAEVLVAPSLTTRLWAEQVGMVLLQAMGCGVPVVSTTSGSIPEFVEHGITGLLVPEHNPVALAGAIHQILSNPSLRSTLSTNAHNHTRKQYDARKNVQIAEELILERCMPQCIVC